MFGFLKPKKYVKKTCPHCGSYIKLTGYNPRDVAKVLVAWDDLHVSWCKSNKEN